MPNIYKLGKKFNSIKRKEFPWIYEVHQACSGRSFGNLRRAFAYFFKKQKRHPRFHKKGRRDSFYAGCESEHGFSINGSQVRIPKLGWVKMTEALRFSGKIILAVISRSANRWFISITVGTKLSESQRAPKQRKTIGVDLGVKYAAVLSDGRKFDGPKPLKAALKRLKRRQRQLSRKEKDSNNRRRAVAKVAKLHWRIANKRKDFLHKLTTSLCKEAETIVVENLNVSGMLKNHKLARAISDIGWYEFRRQLGYKGGIFGTRLVVAPRFYPSTKRCSSCGAVKKLMRLSERAYVCEECGVVEDRDVNAAMNLEQLGTVRPEVTPVDMEALAGSLCASETTVAEAGIAIARRTESTAASHSVDEI